MASPYALDFSPVANALDGNRKYGLQLQDQEMDRQRLALSQASAGREAQLFPYRKQQIEMELAQAKEAANQQKAQRILGFWEARSDAYSKLPPEQQAVHWQAFRDKALDDDDRAIVSRIPGFDDPVIGPKLLMAYGSKRRDPLDKDLLIANTDKARAEAEKDRAMAAAAGKKGVVGYDNMKDYGNAAESLRKEFNTLPVVKNYVEAQSSADRLKSLVDKSKGGAFGSGAGDIAMVFSFIKSLDPTSVVQPGEQATARNAPGVTDQLLNTYNRILNGEFLTGKTRDDFVKVIESELAHRKAPAVAQGRRFRQIARDTRIDPEHVMPRIFGGVDLDGDGVPDAAQPPPPPGFNPPPRGQQGAAPAFPPRQAVQEPVAPARPAIMQTDPRFSAAPQPQAQGSIKPGAVRLLQQNPTPEVIQQFEAKYGPGSAQQFLQQR
jgi:hypothetical protein